METLLFGGLYLATPAKLDAQQPFVDKRVRQAMNLAINRPALAATLLGGKAQPMRVACFNPTTDEALWPGIWNPAWEQQAEEQYGYQPAKAKALLKEAGYEHGFAFTVYLYTLPGLPELIDIGQALAFDWEAIGLKPKLVEIDFPRVREQYRTKAIHGAVWPGAGSPNASISHLQQGHGVTVYAYEHPATNRLVALDTVEPRARGGCCGRWGAQVLGVCRYAPVLVVCGSRRASQVRGRVHLPREYHGVFYAPGVY
jgi:ABC-type transport system substrate-binding protein